MIANNPKPPYYAVIFTSLRTPVDDGYSEMSERMVALAKQQPGDLGYESARNEIGVTSSYWQSLDAIKNWKAVAEHLEAQNKGIRQWYQAYTTRICHDERDYSFEKPLQ